MTTLKLKTKQERRYQDTKDNDLKLAIYQSGIEKALATAKKLPEWLGEATILQLRNGLERMKVAIASGNPQDAEKILNETMELYTVNTLIPIGYAWKEKDIEQRPAEKRLEFAQELGKDYMDLRDRIDAHRQAGETVGELERIAA